TPLLGTEAEALERRQGHVLLVRRPPHGAAQPLMRQPHQPRVIALPQIQGGRAVALFQLLYPARDVSAWRHGPLSLGSEQRGLWTVDSPHCSTSDFFRKQVRASGGCCG